MTEVALWILIGILAAVAFTWIMLVLAIIGTAVWCLVEGNER